MIDEILKIWQGYSLQFPIVRGREDDTFVFKVKGDTRGIIVTYPKIKNGLAETGSEGFLIPESEMTDIFMIDDLFKAPVIIVVDETNMMYAKASDFYLNRHKLIQCGEAFLPKEHFKILKRGQ